MPSATDPLDCVCRHLRRTARSLTATFDHALRPSRLRSTQFTLLHAVSLQNGTSLVPLARKTGMDRTTLARSLETLEKAGLIRLAASPSDKRKMLAHLTPDGHKALAVALPLWRVAQAHTLKALSRKNWEKLYRRLELIDTALDPDARKAPPPTK